MTGLPELLRLNEFEEVTLTGLLLALMNEDLKAVESKNRDSERFRIRRLRRNQLRFERSLSEGGRGHHDELEIEKPEGLRDRLGNVRSPAHALQLLVTAAAHQPYMSGMPKGTAGRLATAPRRTCLQQAAQSLGLSIREADSILDRLDPKAIDTVARRATQAVLIGGAVWIGVATAGVAAPAIGTAVGGAMGLSGAAATGAGLAAFGGGSLAAGGAGMAGGTALIGALGGMGGAGVGALAASGVPKGELAAQAAQLAALIHAAGPMDRETRTTVRGQGTLIEIEIGRLVGERAALQLARVEWTSTTEEINSLAALRRMLPMPDKFELP